MSNLVQLSCAIVDPDPGNVREMTDFLGGRGVYVLAQLPSVEQLASTLAGGDAPPLVIVNLDPRPHETLRMIEPLVRQHAQVSFFALSQVLDPALLMDAMQIGVRQFVPLPIDEQRLMAGIERVAQAHGMGERARILHVVPASGGCGATTIACNVAAALARSGRTVLVDLDLVGGTVATSFDVQPRYTISDLMDHTERLDKNVLETALAVHEPTGLAILARPEMPEDAHRVDEAGFGRLMQALSRAFDYVVLDSQLSAEPVHGLAAHLADLNLIVTQLNVPNARNAERFVQTLRRSGVTGERIRVVINRYVKRGQELEPEQVERTLGLKISWLVPNDFKNAMSAMNYGQPVVLRAPRAEISASLMGLAKALNGKA